MNTKKYLKTVILMSLSAFIFSSFGFSQTSEPKQEKLLNGLKLLVWQNPKDPKVSFKLRIHSGAAFDPKDKMGVMALLADILFPDSQTREFFEQDLEGSLSVTSNYDYIQIDATGKSDEFLSMLETLSTAVTNPTITPETFENVRKSRLENVSEEQKNPTIIANQIAAKRLFGDYPYGRPQSGTVESLAKVDRIDITVAREKFLTADNSTLTISGNVNFALAVKASKQFFGGWKKSDKLVPATFATPEDVESKPLTIPGKDTANDYKLSIASTVGRNNKDYYATKIAVASFNSIFCNTAFTYNSYFLRGTFVRNTMIPGVKNSQPCEPISNTSVIIGNEKFLQEKAKLVSEMSQLATEEMWLNIDTYKLVSVKDEMQKLNSVTLADVQRVSESLLKQRSMSVNIAKAF
jgi:predicted Zn-dependent peptidase